MKDLGNLTVRKSELWENLGKEVQSVGRSLGKKLELR